MGAYPGPTTELYTLNHHSVIKNTDDGTYWTQSNSALTYPPSANHGEYHTDVATSNAPTALPPYYKLAFIMKQ